MLRWSYPLELSLTHAHSAFSAEGSRDQTIVWSSLASFYGQWNIPCTVLTDRCLFLSSMLATWIGNNQEQICEWDRCCHRNATKPLTVIIVLSESRVLLVCFIICFCSTGEWTSILEQTWLLVRIFFCIPLVCLSELKVAQILYSMHIMFVHDI